MRETDKIFSSMRRVINPNIKSLFYKFLFVLVIVLLLILAFSCSIISTDNNKKTNIELVDQESDEYELLIFDTGFDSWFITRNIIANSHSNSYYQNWNYIYVSEWNDRFYKGDPDFENRIEYYIHEQYDLELNYTLYNYFLYIEEKLNTTLVYRGR